MSPARTTSANKKSKVASPGKGKTTPKRLVKNNGADESNDMKILDTWKGMKVVKVNHYTFQLLLNCFILININNIPKTIKT